MGSGVPHTFGVPAPPQISGSAQMPQASQLPQPSTIPPQLAPCASQVVGVHGPQTLSTPPPPHVWGRVQLPQSSVSPQPSSRAPQFLPSAAQVIGAQTGGGMTARYARVWLVMRFSAVPTITVPSPDTAVPKRRRLLSVSTPRSASTTLRSSIARVGVQRNARVRPSIGALPTTTEPSADSALALLLANLPPRFPRSSIPTSGVQRKPVPQFPDIPTTDEPSDEVANA